MRSANGFGQQPFQAQSDHDEMSFDTVEILGLIVPVLFAIFTIVLVAMNPQSGSTTAETTPERPEVVEQIHNKR